MRVLQLSHGGHEGLLGQVAARALLQERLLVRAVQLLGELRRLQGRQAARHTVDDRDALRLRGVEACGSKRERSGTLQRGGEVNGRQRLPPGPWSLPKREALGRARDTRVCTGSDFIGPLSR